ncbi:uncharacterized protein LOC142521796 [Primulina tabacum]|uniref:uncharacterized protein LOC142521796 n=1 Tax=Primulina tabacum TaxID=48773 RepID=UPI003F59E487
MNWIRTLVHDEDHWLQTNDSGFSRAILLPGTPPEKARELLELGLIQKMILSPELKEIDQFPIGLRTMIRHYKTNVFGHEQRPVQLELRMTSTIPDFDGQRFYEPYQMISLSRYIQFSGPTNLSREIISEENLKPIRVQSILTLLQKTSKIDETSNIKINYCTGKFILTTGYKKKTTVEELKQIQVFKNKIYEGNADVAQGTKKAVCKAIKKQMDLHQCPLCEIPESPSDSNKGAASPNQGPSPKIQETSGSSTEAQKSRLWSEMVEEEEEDTE